MKEENILKTCGSYGSNLPSSFEPGQDESFKEEVLERKEEEMGPEMTEDFEPEPKKEKKAGIMEFLKKLFGKK